MNKLNPNDNNKEVDLTNSFTNDLKHIDQLEKVIEDDVFQIIEERKKKEKDTFESVVIKEFILFVIIIVIVVGYYIWKFVGV